MKVIFLLTLILMAKFIIANKLCHHNYNILNNGEPIVFAHRGHVDNNVENSRSSFLKSDKLGYTAIETDISCTKDGKLIIFHDDNATRLLGIDKDITELEWKDIEDSKLLYNESLTSNSIITLERLLNRNNSQKILYLDFKESSKAIADSLLSILEENNNKDNIIIADANYLFLAYLKVKNPDLSVCLEGFNKGKEFLYYLFPEKLRPDYYSSFLFEVDKKHMKFLKKYNIINNRIVYGVEAKNIQDAYDLGIKNIILDHDSSMTSIDEIREELIEHNF